MKRYVEYIGVLVLFYLLVTFLNWANDKMAEVVRTFYRYIEYSILVQIISFVLIGLFVGGFQFVREFRKAGKWQINKEKLIVIGLPLFLLLAMINLMYFGVSWPSPIGRLLLDIGSSRITVPGIGILLGFVAMTSFYKNQNIS